MTKLCISLDALASGASMDSLSRRRHRQHIKPKLTKEQWEAKKAEQASKNQAPKTPAKEPSKSTIVKKSDTSKIKELTDKGYVLVGHLQGDPSHLLYEPGKPKETPKEPVSHPDWWSKLNRKEQEAYLEEHPGSSMEITAPEEPEEPKPGTPKPSDPEDDVIPLDDEDDQGEEDEDGESQEATVSLKGKIEESYRKRRAKVASVLKHHKTGLGAIKTLISGGKVTPRDYDQAKKTAVLTAKLVLGTLVGIALFTALAPLAAPLAKYWLNGGVDDSFSSEASEDDEKLALEIADHMYSWLTKQNIPELIEKLKSEKAT